MALVAALGLASLAWAGFAVLGTRERRLVEDETRDTADHVRDHVQGTLTSIVTPMLVLERHPELTSEAERRWVAAELAIIGQRHPSAEGWPLLDRAYRPLNALAAVNQPLVSRALRALPSDTLQSTSLGHATLDGAELFHTAPFEPQPGHTDVVFLAPLRGRSGAARFLTAVVDVFALVQESAPPPLTKSYRITLRRKGRELYRVGPESPSKPSGLAVDVPIQAAGVHWTVVVRPASRVVTGSASVFDEVALGLGLVLSGLGGLTV